MTIDGIAITPHTPSPAATGTTQSPAMPRSHTVQAIGEHLYINGIACCPWCLKTAGSCGCGPDEVAVVLATAPHLPPIHINLRGAR